MLKKLQPHKKYKKVVYDYIHELPDGWEVFPNIAIFQERIERWHDNEELLSVTIGKGVIKQTEVDIKKDNSNENKSKYKLIKIGDVAYNKMRMRQGALGYSNYQWISSPAYVILKPKIQLNSKFFHYMFRTNFYTNYSKRFSYGIVDDQLSLRYTDFKRMYSIVPPIDIQNNIVKYLDQKNSEIDKFIKNKENLIQLLVEERDYCIENAIFKWIKNNVKFFDTKNDILGQIPVGRKVKKIKHIAGVNPNKPSNKYSKNSLDEVVFLPMEQVSVNWEISNEYKKTIKELWSGFTYFAKNDILMAKITPCFENWKGAFLDKLESDIGFWTTEFHVLRAKKDIEPIYLYHILRTKRFKTLGEENMQWSAGQQRVPVTFLKNFPICLPSKEEQRGIIEYIQDKIKITDAIVSKAKKEINAIKEYRESLITNIVLGRVSC
jgi:type I restriction enzyme, S subunit